MAEAKFKTAPAHLSASGEFRGRIYDSIVETIGATPLVRLARFAARARSHGPKSWANASSSTRFPRSRTASGSP